jgi:hypothetical protein
MSIPASFSTRNDDWHLMEASMRGNKEEATTPNTNGITTPKDAKRNLI